jgi:hypothetical protein
MNNIESAFVEYSEITDEFEKQKLISRYKTLLVIATDFIQKMGYSNSVYINEMILLYAMCDYFSDILRLKSFHNIDRINEIKILSYEIYWLLKRKPLQIRDNNKDFIYVNEQFALSRILHYLSDDKKESTRTLGGDKLEFFVNTLLYYLKYRPFDAQSLEMFLISFNAGVIFEQEQKNL